MDAAGNTVASASYPMDNVASDATSPMSVSLLVDHANDTVTIVCDETIASIDWTKVALEDAGGASVVLSNPVSDVTPSGHVLVLNLTEAEQVALQVSGLLLCKILRCNSKHT